MPPRGGRRCIEPAGRRHCPARCPSGSRRRQATARPAAHAPRGAGRLPPGPWPHGSRRLRPTRRPQTRSRGAPRRRGPAARTVRPTPSRAHPACGRGRTAGLHRLRRRPGGRPPTDRRGRRPGRRGCWKQRLRWTGRAVRWAWVRHAAASTCPAPQCCHQQAARPSRLPHRPPPRGGRSTACHRPLLAQCTAPLRVLRVGPARALSRPLAAIPPTLPKGGAGPPELGVAVFAALSPASALTAANARQSTGRNGLALAAARLLHLLRLASRHADRGGRVRAGSARRRPTVDERCRRARPGDPGVGAGAEGILWRKRGWARPCCHGGVGAAVGAAHHSRQRRPTPLTAAC